MTAPADREFEILERGHVRDRIVLANWRNGLRSLVNPETGTLFTEDEIARATQKGSRWWIEANTLDLYGQGDQRRAIFLSDQERIERANTAWLEDFHGRLWGESRLPATGGSGAAAQQAVAGTIIVGSTTIPDPAAYSCRDAAGKRYQVFTTVVTPAGGTATITLAAIDTGDETNLVVGDKLTWITRDPNMAPTATVSSNFSGGTDEETDGEFASRMMGNIRHRPAAGNDAHFRAWGRAASNAVEDAFVFPCALHAGTTLVAVSQKRAGVAGPLARIPSVSTLAALIAHITPPASAVVPGRALIVGVPVNALSSDLVLLLALSAGSAAGWEDVTPFPAFHATTPHVQAITTQSHFSVHCPGDATLPGQVALATVTGDDVPSIMIWNEGESEFEELSISQAQDLGGNIFDLTLSAQPSFTVTTGDIVSPMVGRHTIVSQAISDYFDEFGPGDLFDTATDPRGARCVRFPRAIEERPFRAGAVVATRVIEALGGSSADGTLSSISVSTPTYPTNITDGPRMLVCGSVGIYSL